MTNLLSLECCYAEDKVTPLRLTDDMRQWLESRDRRMLCKDVVLGFIRQFSLTPDAAGRLIAEWVKSIPRHDDIDEEIELLI